MSENGNKMSKNKKIAILVTAALVVTIPTTIGIMCYYKLGPFGEKPSAPSAVPNKAKNHKSTVKPIPEINDYIRNVDRKEFHNNNSLPPAQTQNGECNESYATASVNVGSVAVHDGGSEVNSVSLKFTGPLKRASFDFEVNTDIKNRKAFAAYDKLWYFSDADKDEIGRDTYKTLEQNLVTTHVEFTDTENIGIVHVLARFLSLHSEMIDQLIEEQMDGVSDVFSSYLNLLVELACHIKMRKEGEKVSLSKYNEYLYTIKEFAELKKKITGDTNLYGKAILEAKIFNVYYTGNYMFQMGTDWLRGFISKEFFDTIIPPSES